MNFLNPLYLFALAAVAVPILIHIFSRRRVPEVPFSTIRFLSGSDRRSMMRINMRRLLLLLLRVLAVALVALAFARPVVRGSLAALFPSGGSRAACILLDRSFSMGVEGNEGVAFDRAVARVGAIVDNLERGDEVSLVLFDTKSEIVYNGELERQAVRDALRNARLSWAGTDLRGAAAFGERLLAASRREVRELYIVSDFQKTGMGRAGASGEALARTDTTGARAHAAAEPAERGSSSPGARPGAALPVRAFLLPVQSNVEANVSVERVVAPSVALHEGETAELGIVLRNRSRTLAAKFPLEVSLGGRRVMEKEIEIPPDDYRTERAAFPVERAGWVDGVVKKRSDRLPADDTRYFALDVRRRTRVLLIADEGGFYLEQALGPGGAEGDIAVVKRGWRAFTSADLDTADVVVLGPGRGPAAGDVEIVDRFVKRGGKAIVFLVPELEEAAARLSRHTLRIEFADMPQGFFRLSKPAPAPGFLAPFDERDLEALARLRFRSAALVRGVPLDEVKLSFERGGPFVWDERRGGGTVVFVAADPRPEAGELVLSPYFLPLVQQLVLAAGAEPPANDGSLIGEPIFWSAAGSEDECTCTLPDGTTIKPARDEAGAASGSAEREVAGSGSPRDGAAVERAGGILIPPVETPGIVTIFAGSDVAGKIAVNPDCREESDLAYLDPRAAADSLGLAHRLVVAEDGALAPAIRAARTGREITMPVLLAAMALLAIELFVAQREKGEPG
jgi:hypothetical protein